MRYNTGLTTRFENNTTNLRNLDFNFFVKTLPIFLPNDNTQQKIVSLLSNVDNAIKNANQLIKKIESLKKGMLQGLTIEGIGHNSFKSITLRPKYLKYKIPNEWKVEKLKNLLSLLKDGTHNPPERTKKGIRLLSSEHVHDGILDFEKSVSFISNEDYKEMHKKYEIFPQDILLTIIGASIGRVAIVPKIQEKFSVQRSVAIFRPNEKIFFNYLYYFMQTHYFQKQLQIRANATGQAGVYLGEMGKIDIFYPDTITEQKKISSNLSNIDSHIHKQKLKKINLVLLKKGLMQKIFIGKITVKI